MVCIADSLRRNSLLKRLFTVAKQGDLQVNYNKRKLRIGATAWWAVSKSKLNSIDFWTAGLGEKTRSMWMFYEWKFDSLSLKLLT